MSEIAARVEKLRPRLGEVVVVDLIDEADEADLAALAAELSGIAGHTRATVLLLPVGVTIETIDEREMLARGWMRVGPLAHTTAQLTAPPAELHEQLPSA